MRINLLKSRRVLSEKEYLREKLWLQYSVWMLVVLAVVITTLFLWYWLLLRKYEKVNQSYLTVSSELQGLTEANASQLYLRGRLELITGFMDDRLILRNAIQKILTLDITDVNVAGMSIVTDDELSIKLVAFDSDALSSALNYLKSEIQFFTQVVSEGIVRTKDGNFELTARLKMPSKTEIQ